MAFLALALTVLAGAPVATAPQQDEKNELPPTEKISTRVILPRNRRPLFMELTLVDEDPMRPLVVLLHEARSSLGEYRPIVPRLRELGYNGLSVDLSSGEICGEVKNLTARRVKQGGGKSDYLDTQPDILDALLWARENRAHGKLVLWGSGYSASLAVVMAAEHPDLIDGVVAVSAGEYFTAVGKSDTWVCENAARVTCPALFLSPRSDEGEWKAIFEALGTDARASVLYEGPRGSRALWPDSPGSRDGWTAVETFLRARFPATVEER